MFNKTVFKKSIAFLLFITIIFSLQSNIIFASVPGASRNAEAASAGVPTISVGDATSITQTGARVAVDISYDSTLHVPGSGFIYYSLSNNPETDGNSISIGAASGTFDIPGLSAGTTYYYTAVLNYKAVGDDTPLKVTSQIKSFTTQAPPAPPAPSVTIDNPTVMYSGLSTAVVTFSYSSANCTVTEYGVEVNDAPNSPVASTQSGATYSKVISGLEVGPTYIIKGYVKYLDASNIAHTKYSGVVNYKHATVKPSVTTKAASYSSSLGNISATATIVTSGSSDVTNKGFVYSFDNSVPTVDDNKSKVDGNVLANTTNVDYSTIIIPQSGKTKCYIRAYATSIVDTVYGAVITVDLPGTVAVTTNAATDITGNSATANTRVTNVGLGISNSGVVYSKSASNLTKGASNSYYKEDSITAIGTRTYSLTNLEPGTTYYVKAYVINRNGILTYDSSYVSFTTSSSTSSVTTNSSTNIAANSATGNINVSSVGAGISYSGVVYSTSTSYLTKGSSNSSYKEASNTTTGTKTYSLTNLEPSTVYYVKGYVINKSGSITYASNYTSFTTLNNSNIPTVRTVSTSNVTNTTVDVTINVTSDNGYSITDRGVVYSTSNSTPTMNDSSKSIGGTTGSSTFTLYSLTANKTYYVRAYAKNSKGVAYGTVLSFKTTNTSDSAPSASTSGVSNVTSYTAEVDINITNAGSSNVTDRGVVYSSSNSYPEIGLSGCSKQSVSGTTGRAVVVLSSLNANTTYYVRSYARNSSGYAYGDVKTFTTARYDNIPAVTTDSVTTTSATSFDARINVTKDNGYAVTERGVVYSRTNSSIVLNGSSVLFKTTPGTTGTGTVSVTGLTAGTTYYVRAYATNRYGTAYGAVKEITTSQYTVTTGTPTNITASGATVSGVVSSSSDKITDRGIVYSATNPTPTISDYYVSANTTATSYSVSLAGLAINTKYYARAYIKTSEGYSYGSVVNFTTGNNDFAVTVLYKTWEGQQVGGQTLNLKKGVTIKQDTLSLPAGYELVTPTFSYLVQGSETITAYVKKKTSSGAFMEGTSNKRFEPERKITRLEVAKMIYALNGKPNMAKVRTYTDIPDDFPEQAAINYVSSMEFMTGFPDGSFRPYANITRAEVAVVCNNVYSLTSQDMTNPFKDINNHWGKKYITIAYKNGAISGYPDKTFKPELNMTRAEAATLFAKAEKRDLTPLGQNKFSDVPTTHWAYKYIMNAAVPSA